LKIVVGVVNVLALALCERFEFALVISAEGNVIVAQMASELASVVVVVLLRAHVLIVMKLQLVSDFQVQKPLPVRPAWPS
jgi:hypothetical protein